MSERNKRSPSIAKLADLKLKLTEMLSQDSSTAPAGQNSRGLLSTWQAYRSSLWSMQDGATRTESGSKHELSLSPRKRLFETSERPSSPVKSSIRPSFSSSLKSLSESLNAPLRKPEADSASSISRLKRPLSAPRDMRLSLSDLKSKLSESTRSLAAAEIPSASRDHTPTRILRHVRGTMASSSSSLLGSPTSTFSDYKDNLRSSFSSSTRSGQAPLNGNNGRAVSPTTRARFVETHARVKIENRRSESREVEPTRGSQIASSPRRQQQPYHHVNGPSSLNERKAASIGSPSPRHKSYREELQRKPLDELFPISNVARLQDLLIDVSDQSFNNLPPHYVRELIKLSSVIMHRVNTSQKYANTL
eukprot:GILJ01004012.1.p1 GENE.GILJ01004012.1~~GILJ01004012.1.p1  ORF type:complete len:373 (-),score=38.27 GILJ01004012.1:313-1401(-)